LKKELIMQKVIGVTELQRRFRVEADVAAVFYRVFRGEVGIPRLLDDGAM
jgi:hypothetical protein